MKKAFLLLAGFVSTAALLSLQSCTTVTQVTSGVLVATGQITPQQGESMVRVAEAGEKTFKDITPEQEYYIGRTVGATIVSKYKVYDHEAATRYLNIVGQTAALSSDKPETFGGYHFLILDTDEINAFAAPGGFIFVSRGMLRLCKSEDEVASVLAHEVGHVQLAHAISAIKSSRLTSAFTILAVEAGKNLGGENLAEVTKAFEGSITDITSTLMNSGYARKQERQADESAITIMKRVGYNPRALITMLQEMEKQLKPDRHDFAATHPKPADRIADIEKLLANYPPVQISKARQNRFAKFIADL
jgi:predicted Zn-dependent protease